MPTEPRLLNNGLHARISRLTDEGGLPVVIAKTIHAGYQSDSKLSSH